MIRAVLALLSPRTASEPRICDGCARVFTSLTPAQCAVIGSDRLPQCRRRGCDGRLYRATGEATDRLVTDIKNGAPGWTPGTPPETPTDWLESKDMETVPREAQHLRPGDILTRHPDHPNREVWYRVDGWPRRVSHAQMLVNYTCRPARLSGDSAGVLVLDIDQECQVVPAHTQGGAA